MKDASTQKITGSLCAVCMWALLSISPALTSKALADHPGTSSIAFPESNPEALDQAIALYNSRRYSEARDALEQLIANSDFKPRLCYYAALANLESGRKERARQLFKYLVDQSPGTQEAIYASEALNEVEPKHLRSNKKAIADNSTSQANQQTRQFAEHPFTPQDIGEEGPNGVDQGAVGNCWFEAALSVLAGLPRGQERIANMISWGKSGAYLVRFSDGSQFSVSREEARPIRDHAWWAKILDCAERKKYPNQHLDTGPGKAYKGNLEAGMALITGCRDEAINPGELDPSQVEDFIYTAIKSQNPVTAASKKSQSAPGLTKILVPGHVYAVIDIDTSRHKIILRNPWGSNPSRQSAGEDAINLKYQNGDGGKITLSLAEFQKYFWCVARSFI